jgi:hypothetical protein
VSQRPDPSESFDLSSSCWWLTCLPAFGIEGLHRVRLSFLGSFLNRYFDKSDPPQSSLSPPRHSRQKQNRKTTPSDQQGPWRGSGKNCGQPKSHQDDVGFDPFSPSPVSRLDVLFRPRLILGWDPSGHVVDNPVSPWRGCNNVSGLAHCTQPTRR